MTAREWLQKAKDEKFAIGAFNVGNLETFKAIVSAAANKKSPLIIESSPGETSWLGSENIVDLARNFSAEFSVPVLVNLDHTETLEDCLKGIEAGYDMIHFDGSKLPLEQNLEIARKVVEAAHQRGLTVEVEMDHIGGSSEMHAGSVVDDLGKVPMTDPEKAALFMRDSGADILAVFVGNLHGVYSAGDENIDIERLRRINEASGCLLSLHGASGLPDDQVKEAIQNGIVKVNINTELRLAFKEELTKVLAGSPDEAAMYKIEKPVVESIQKVVEQKIEVFGSEGKI